MKICQRCKISKDEDDFAWRVKSKGLRQSYCRVCRKEQDRQAWESGSRKLNNYANKKKRININRDYVWSYLTTHSCVDCGESDPIVLEFDHLRDKIMDVGAMIHDRCSLQKIKLEIEKCEVVCANCHKRRTSRRANHWRHVRMAE